MCIFFFFPEHHVLEGEEFDDDLFLLSYDSVEEALLVLDSVSGAGVDQVTAK